MLWLWIITIILSLGGAILWFLFYFLYFPKELISQRWKTILMFFVGGAIGAGVVLFIELNVFPFLFQSPHSSVLPFGVFQGGKLAILVPFVLVTFFFIAPLEEFFKWLLLGTGMNSRPHAPSSVIESITFGVVTGLGFAAIENVVHIYHALSSSDVHTALYTILLRLSTTTLAHSLYGGVMGYFLGLSHFYRLYAGQFSRKAFFIPDMIHGFYNIFLFTSLNALSLILMAALLIIVAKWLSDRREIESYFRKKAIGSVPRPFWGTRGELESMLSKNQISTEIIKKLHLCPFCFEKSAPDEVMCRSCKKKKPVSLLK